MPLLQVDLLGLDAEELNWYQMGTRALIVFFIALLFIRIAGMRSFGTQSAFDVVLTITLGAILGRAIAGHYPFFACLFAAVVLALLHRLVAFLSSRSKLINKLTEGDAQLLFNKGAAVQQNLSRHCITEKDLLQALHEANLDNFEQVRAMWLEPDGKISVIKKMRCVCHFRKYQQSKRVISMLLLKPPRAAATNMHSTRSWRSWC